MTKTVTLGGKKYEVFGKDDREHIVLVESWDEMSVATIFYLKHFDLFGFDWNFDPDSLKFTDVPDGLYTCGTVDLTVADVYKKYKGVWYRDNREASSAMIANLKKVFHSGKLYPLKREES